MPGYECGSNADCASGVCRTHCCDVDVEPACLACGSSNGYCYAPLGLSDAWNASMLNEGWSQTLNKDEKSDFVRPQLDFVQTMLSSKKGADSLFRFRLMWSSTALPKPALNDNGRPPSGLVAAGEGADPGLVDVDASSGQISALPRRNGNYSMYLIIEDAGGTATNLGLLQSLDQVVVKRWDFTVLGKPDFVVTYYERVTEGLLQVSSGEDPFITTAKIGSIECTVGTMYHLAPIDASTMVFMHASGGSSAKIRFTIRNPPPGYFIEPSTAEIQGNPQAASAGKSFTSTLIAVDPAGQETELEKIEISILAKPQFVPVFSDERVGFDNDGYVDPRLAGQSFIVGENYKIAPFRLERKTTKVSAGSMDDISYTLSADAPTTFCVQAKSGDISGTFATPGNYSFAVLAVDQAGESAVAEQLHISVTEQPVFDLSVSSSRTRNGSQFTDPSESTASFVEKESYRFSPLQLIRSNTTVSAGTFDDVTFTLDADDGWFVSAKTGEIFGQFEAPGLFSMTLYAVDKGGEQAVIERMEFVVEKRPELDVVLEEGRARTGAEFTDPSSIDFAVIANESYRFSPRRINRTSTTVSSGSISDITYTLVAGDGWFCSSQSGEIFGQFVATGYQTLSLFAVDAGGEQQRVEMLSFDVQPRATFSVGLAGGGGGDVRSKAEERGYSDPFAISEYVVGITYKIAALILDRNTTTVSSGVYEDIAFTLSADAPDTFFVQAKTGVISGSFDNPGEYTFALLALDAGGQTAQVERYDFTVVQPSQFVLRTLAERTFVGEQFTDPSKTSASSSARYFVGDTYKIAPRRINVNVTTVSAGTVDNITYTLSSDAPSSFFVQAGTGVIFGQFEAVGESSFSLLAVDLAGQTAVAEQYTFGVVERGEFKVLQYDSVADESTTYVDLDSNVALGSNYAIGDTYRFAPIEITEVEHTADSTADLGFTVEGAPVGFLIDPTDGYIQGTPTADSVDEQFQMTLYAVDSKNRKALIQTIDLNIRFKDVAVRSNGPNGQPCNNSGIPVDRILFDSMFTCDCSPTRFEGENCNDEVASSSSASFEGGGNTALVAGGLVGGMALLFLVGIVFYKRHLHAIEMRAFDFEAEIARLVNAGEIDADDEGHAGRIPREVKRSHVTMIHQVGEGML